jgi:hypothetical protein
MLSLRFGRCWFGKICGYRLSVEGDQRFGMREKGDRCLTGCCPTLTAISEASSPPRKRSRCSSNCAQYSGMLLDNQEYCNNLSLFLRSKTGMLDDSGPCLRSDRRFRCADRIQHPDFGAFVMRSCQECTGPYSAGTDSPLTYRHDECGPDNA